MLSKLRALYLEPEKQKKFSELLPDVNLVATMLGEFEFCLNKSEEYVDGERSASTNQFPHKLFSGLKWEIRTGTWFVFSLVAAALNIEATISIAPEDFGGEFGRHFIAFLASVTLVFFVDFFIAKEVNGTLTRRDARKEKASVNELIEQGRGVIEESLWLGAKQGFHDIQSTYLPTSKVSSAISYGLLTFYFSVEFGSSLGRHSMVGGELDWLAVIAPLLGAMLNMMTGYFNGIAIQYPKSRHSVASRYRSRSVSIEEKGELEKEISLANHLTDLYLQNPNFSSEDLVRQKYSLRFANQLKKIRDTYEPGIAELKKAHKEELKTLREEMRQSPSDRNALQLEMNESKEDFFDSSIEMLQIFQEALSAHCQEVNAHGLQAEAAEAILREVTKKEEHFQSEKKHIAQQENRLQFAGRLKEIRDDFETERARRKKHYQEEIKELKQSIRSNPENREEIQLDINQYEENYLGDSIRNIQMCQSDLKELIRDMQEADVSSEVAESVWEDLERQRLLLSGKSERFQQEQVALQFNARFKQIREQCNSNLDRLKGKWENDRANVEAHKRMVVVGKPNEAEFRAQENEYHQKYQLGVLKLIDGCVLELEQLQVEMKKANCSTDVLEGSIRKLNEEHYTYGEKLERLREEEQFLRRSVAS